MSMAKVNRHVGFHVLCHGPRDPLAPHLALPNHLLAGRGVLRYYPARPTGSAVGAILLCDLSRSAAQARKFSPRRLPGVSPFPVLRRPTLELASS